MSGNEIGNPVRVNTRISTKYNDWLDQRAIETSLSKSALINMAIENYIKEVKVTANLEEMLMKVKGLEELQDEIIQLKQEMKQIKGK